MSVDEWGLYAYNALCTRQEKRYKMKKIEEFSPEFQSIIGFVKPNVTDDGDINGDKARMEHLSEK
jgi:hypothetical protein